jgi:hypothetical protein
MPVDYSYWRDCLRRKNACEQAINWNAGGVREDLSGDFFFVGTPTPLLPGGKSFIPNYLEVICAAKLVQTKNL